MISIKEVAYKNYGKCVAISNELMEVLVTVDVGPRIIKCNIHGKENMLFEDIERVQKADVCASFGPGKTWYTYGGHRIWLSPEEFPLTYYPDNEKVLYTVNARGAEFMPETQSVTGLKITMSIEMAEDKPEIKITHKITNTLRSPIKGAVWCITVMDAGGTAVLPMPTEDTGLLPNRAVVLWPYANMSEKRHFWGDRYIAVKQDPLARTNTKIGINNTSGKSAYINHSQALVKTVEYIKDGEYPDFGCTSEIYANNIFEELETLSPFQTIAKDETMEHIETWTLVDNIEQPEMNNEALDEVAKKIF